MIWIYLISFTDYTNLPPFTYEQLPVLWMGWDVVELRPVIVCIDNKLSLVLLSVEPMSLFQGFGSEIRSQLWKHGFSIFSRFFYFKPFFSLILFQNSVWLYLKHFSGKVCFQIFWKKYFCFNFHFFVLVFNVLEPCDPSGRQTVWPHWAIFIRYWQQFYTQK